MDFSIPQSIKDAIKNDSLVLFIGAGLSKPLGFPDWKQLVIGLINECSKDNPSLAKFTPVYEDGLMDTMEILAKLESYEGRVRSYLESTFDIDYFDKKLVLQKQLWKISNQIITTNYDKAIESVSDSNTQVFNQTTTNKVKNLGGLKNYLFKLHGSIDNSIDCILFESDYKKLYTETHPAIFKLKQILSEKTVLFIGFSMDDPYIRLIAAFMKEMFKGLNSKHYLLKTNNDRLEDLGIEPTNIENWGNLESYLDELINIKTESASAEKKEVKGEEVRSTAPIVSQSNNNLNDYPKPDPLFTGREKEIKLFKEALETHKIFAVEGLGGAGKTELVSKCIHDFIEDKSRIIWLPGSAESKFDVFVESAGYGEVLKGENKTQQAIFSGFKDLVERDNRIIFWDNYQSITDPTFDVFINFAHKYLDKSRIIFIAKQEVYVGGSPIRTVNVEGLGEDALQYALKLRDNNERFKNVSDNDIKTLCETTLGHPLAIKLYIPLISKGIKSENLLSDLVKYKERREVEELTKRIFDEVYGTCSEQEKKMLQKISVFINKVPIEAIEYLFGDDPVITLLDLIDKFLVSTHENQYELHPLIRQISNDLLTEKIETHALAATYYIKQRTEQLQPALEAQIYYHLSQSNQWELLEKEIGEKGRKYISLGQLGLVKELVDRLKEVGIEKPIFNIFYGDIAEVYGKWEDAKAHYQLARQQENDIKIKIEGGIKEGEIHYRKGEVKSAIMLFENALSIAVDGNYRSEQARALNDIGLIHIRNGQYEKAFTFCEESLAIRRIHGSAEEIAISVSNIGCVLELQENYIGANEKFFESLNIRKSVDDARGMSINYNNISGNLVSLGEIENAKVYADMALDICKRIGYRAGIGDTLENIGAILKKQGHYDESIATYKEASEIFIEIGDKDSLASSLSHIALNYDKKGDLAKSIENHKEALKIRIETDNPFKVATSLHNIATIYSNKAYRKYPEAIEYFFRSIALYKQRNLKIADSLGWLKFLRETTMGKADFNKLAKKVFIDLDEELKPFIPIDEICKEELKLKPPTSKSAPCPCGSGKQYKRCCGKAA